MFSTAAPWALEGEGGSMQTQALGLPRASGEWAARVLVAEPASLRVAPRQRLCFRFPTQP